MESKEEEIEELAAELNVSFFVREGKEIPEVKPGVDLAKAFFQKKPQ